MNKKKLRIICILFFLMLTGCSNNKIVVETSNEKESTMENEEVSTDFEQSHEQQKTDFSILFGDWVTSTNDVINVKKNNDGQKIEVESPYMIGGVMSFVNHDQEKNIYTFENTEEHINFQILNEIKARIWYGKTGEETTGTSAPFEYTKKVQNKG